MSIAKELKVFSICPMALKKIMSPVMVLMLRIVPLKRILSKPVIEPCNLSWYISVNFMVFPFFEIGSFAERIHHDFFLQKVKLRE